MKYKMTQLFYICPRGHVRKNKPSDNYKKKEWEFTYSVSKNTMLHDGYAHSIEHYKYVGPKSVDEKLYEKEKNHIYQAYASEEVYLDVIRGSTYRPLYKQKRFEKEKGVVYMYTVPKTFSVENKYKRFRL